MVVVIIFVASTSALLASASIPLCQDFSKPTDWRLLKYPPHWYPCEVSTTASPHQISRIAPFRLRQKSGVTSRYGQPVLSTVTASTFTTSTGPLEMWISGLGAFVLIVICLNGFYKAAGMYPGSPEHVKDIVKVVHRKFVLCYPLHQSDFRCRPRTTRVL